MKQVASILFMLACLSTGLTADDAASQTSLKLRESDEIQFWQPGYLQPGRSAELPDDALRFYVLPQVMGAQITHPDTIFIYFGPTSVNRRSGSSTGAFPFYGGEIGLYLNEHFSLNGGVYMGSGSASNSLHSSAAGAFIDRTYSMKMYQGGFTFYLAKILYVSAFAGYRSTDIHSTLGLVVGTQFRLVDVYHVKYDKIVYGFGLGFNFEIADHFLLRIGANLMPQFLAEHGFSSAANEYPVSLQAGLGVIF